MITCLFVLLKLKGSKEGKLMKMLDDKHANIKKLEDKLQVEKQVVAEKDKEIEVCTFF